MRPYSSSVEKYIYIRDKLYKGYFQEYNPKGTPFENQ